MFKTFSMLDLCMTLGITYVFSYMQRLSADDMAGKVLMQKVKYNGFDPKLSEPGKIFFLFVRSHQHSFSYIGMGLHGLNQY